ncbi:MAG: hypothetical protein NTV49_05405 [Kiritimatiellaeota bacterium]|nr:hypothetical protein [Kiritimatiellota bacterium]
MTVRWKGARGLRELPRTVLDDDAERNTWEQDYEGPWSVVMAHRPPVSALSSGGARICKVHCERQKGGIGKMTLTMESLDTSKRTYEIEWCRNELDLLKHPMFNDGGVAALSDEDRVALACWDQEDNALLKTWFLFRRDPSEKPPLGAGDLERFEALSDNATLYAQMRLRGVSAYVYYIPVVRRTQFTSSPNSGDGCNVRVAAPPVPCYPQGFEWVKTADRSMRARPGRWERTEEWTGFDRLDPDRYPQGVTLQDRLLKMRAELKRGRATASKKPARTGRPKGA